MEVYNGLMKLQRLTAEAVSLAAGGRIAELGARLTELQALAEQLPGATNADPAGSGNDRQTDPRGEADLWSETAMQREARRRREEEEIEQMFDNMPV